MIERYVTKVKRATRAQPGFSLVELVVAMVILVIMLTGILFLFEFGLTNARSMQVRSSLNVEASKATEKMVRQMRCARQFIEPTVTPPMTGNPAYFVGDVRGDGTDRDVMFYRTTDNMLYTGEKVGAGNWTNTELAQRVTALNFEYFNSDGQSLGSSITSVNRTSIKRVEFTLTMSRSFSAGASPIQVTKTASIVIRSELSSL